MNFPLTTAYLASPLDSLAAAHNARLNSFDLVTPDGQAIAGTYRLAYDYAPKTKNVRRSVALLHAGGVDPSAQGAVARMTADARSHAPDARASAKPLPDFESIEKSH